MAISLTIDGKEAALKKGSSIEYVSENRIFTDADDYTMEIELPLAGCAQNMAIFGMLTRKDVDTDNIFFDAVLQDTGFFKRGAIVITEITHETVKVQFLEKRSYQNFFPRFDEKYINELDLGDWPALTPSNTTPAQMWARWQDYTALPWVNNSTGVLQNCVKWNASQNRYEWKTTADNDDDLNYSTGFSFHPNLLWLTKKICDTLNYTYDFSVWENSIYKYLMVMNTIPFVWGSRKWAQALPHWTINEFFMELENLLLYEFDIDHKKGHVTCTKTQENVESAGTVLIEKVVDEFSVEVDTEDDDDYKAMLNRGFASGGHRLDNFYSCEWYIHRLTNEDGTVRCTEYETLSQLLAHRLKQDCISDNSGGRGSNLYPGGKWGLHHAQDVDTYFVVEVVERVEYRTQGGNVFTTWGNVCRLVPVNRFGNLILDNENRDSIEELRIVPVCIDVTDKEMGPIVFLECDDNGNDDDTGAWRHKIHDNPFITDAAEQDEVIQFGACRTVGRGERDAKDEIFSNLYVAFWDGATSMFTPHLPHPWIDSFDTDYSYTLQNQGTPSGTMTITWRAIYANHPFSLRINNQAYGQGVERTSFTNIDRKKKYQFSFLAKEIPNVRSTFFIDGKKYLCVKLVANFTEDGMSELIRGEFYKIE
ncbi:MAG: hypothetical protein IKX31_03600 [Muribaculaceae bacterium]|nr:hypothetical protein [Muribaculaceae bacterium]